MPPGKTVEKNRIEILLDYTDDELDQYNRLMAQRDATGTRPRIWEGWPAFIALGFAVAIGAALLAVAAGLVTAHSGANIAVLCFAAYWIGITAPGLATRRHRKLAYDNFRSEWNGARLLATQRGLWFRRDGVRSFISRTAIPRATCSGDLLLLQLSAGQPVALPLRLLTPEQRAFLTTLAS